MASAAHQPTGTIQAADRCGVDHLVGLAPRIAVAVMLSSQQVADLAIHNAGAVCTTSGTPAAIGQWIDACELLLLPVSGAGSVNSPESLGFHFKRLATHCAGFPFFSFPAIVSSLNA
jgi:hypothetical protein